MKVTNKSDSERWENRYRKKDGTRGIRLAAAEEKREEGRRSQPTTTVPYKTGEISL